MSDSKCFPSKFWGKEGETHGVYGLTWKGVLTTFFSSCTAVDTVWAPHYCLLGDMPSSPVSLFWTYVSCGQLHEILRPFLIRRMKKDVLASDGLPPKREVVVYAGMTSLQRSFYDLVERNALRQTLVRGEGRHSMCNRGIMNIGTSYKVVCRTR